MTERSATPVNDVPQELLDVARQAVGAGFELVSLGYESLGYDHPSPVGWLLRLTRRSHEAILAAGDAELFERARDEMVLVSAARGLEPEVYAGTTRADGRPAYWTMEQLREWIDAGAPHAPLLGEPERERALVDHDLFEQAVGNGWAAEVTTDYTLLQLQRSHSPEGPVVLNTRIRLEALNNHFNTKGHPDSRWAGAPVDHTVTLLRQWYPDVGKHMYASLAAGALRVVAGREAFEAAAARVAPWFLPVEAQQSEEHEDS